MRCTNRLLCAKTNAMNIIQRIFGSKTKAPAERIKEANSQSSALQAKEAKPSQPALRISCDTWRYQQILSQIDALTSPIVADNNFMEMFNNIPEVFWPIDFIAKRISEAHFDLKRVKDDSIVWCNRINADRILKQPNPVMTWRELVYQHFVYKLCTGNAFFRASMADTISPDAPKFQWCNNFWELPAHHVYVVPQTYSYGVPVFGIAELDELIQGYKLNFKEYEGLLIPTYQIWHDRDGMPNCLESTKFLKSESRLLSVKKPIANLLAVYEARNVLYLKRGALGFIVAQRQDEAGTVALEPQEKEDLRNELNGRYGVNEGQSPIAITDIPVNFVKTSSSLSEMMPFDETLEDAIKIASIYGTPAVLVPRKDQSTLSNHDPAEKSVYTSTIIPAAKRFCEAITQFLGLEQKGLYLDCDFSDVACLQIGLKEAEEVKKLVNERCLSQFNSGLISINDWRAQIHEDSLEGEIFDKVKFEMTPEEIAKVDSVIKSQASPIQINTGSNATENNKPNTNNKPSTGEDERNDEEPSVRDEGN